MRGKDDNGRRSAAKEMSKELMDDQIIGLGSGSTVASFIQTAAERIESDSLNIFFVPSSAQIAIEAKGTGLNLIPLGYVESVDWTADGADEVDPHLRLVKGGGGALARERVLATLSNRYVVMVDEDKLSPCIGTKSSIPIEFIPPALQFVSKRLREDGFEYALRVDARGYPSITENGNMIVDVKIPSNRNPENFFREFRPLPGVLEVGIFISEADEVIVGGRDRSVRHLHR